MNALIKEYQYQNTSSIFSDNVNLIEGSDKDDILSGTSQDDTLIGGAGNVIYMEERVMIPMFLLKDMVKI
ncbi:hypothetical protein [Snodgrassella alvi]|uniref:hypothetical protein n=1 Tax=Snodgrassella alvi TaxID=1196083 RepID=UPI000C1DEDFD|nr:hypothetical protein [Snodgrassella alvi]PIT31424.1 hypothetical protein BHC42_10835 [Snodgrassella alvi]PIT31871.1 hypothetical protein BHC50_09100 [Snodgrassella alvi]WLT03862.1 hypothetical protein RAM23_08600 [Snodgrassella alvi]